MAVVEFMTLKVTRTATEPTRRRKFYPSLKVSRRVNRESVFSDMDFHSSLSVGDSGESRLIVDASVDSQTFVDDLSDNQAIEFLDTVYAISSTSHPRTAIAYVLRHINSLMLKADFEECDRILLNAEVQKLPSSVLVSFLGITFAARARLKYRPLFYSRAYGHLLSQRGEEATKETLATFK